jgi:hypothetical protein
MNTMTSIKHDCIKDITDITYFPVTSFSNKVLFPLLMRYEKHTDRKVTQHRIFTDLCNTIKLDCINKHTISL